MKLILENIPKLLNIFIFSFKEILCNITSSKVTNISFFQQNGILKNEVKCPGLLVNNTWQFPCGNYMVMKKTKDSSNHYD